MRAVLGRMGRWLATWPHSRQIAIVLICIFWLAGAVAARLDGMALMNLPYGPILADGIPLQPAPPLPGTDFGADTPGDAQTAAIEKPTEALRPPLLPDPLIVATEGNYPPFNFVDVTGALRGLEIDLVYAVCARLKVRCDVVQRDWEDLLPGLKAGDYHMVAASLRVAGPNGETTSEGVVFSNPYFQAAAAYARRRPDTTDAADLEVVTPVIGPVGVQEGTRMATYLTAQHSDVDVRTYPDAISSYEALAVGDVETVLDDAVRLNRWLNDPSGACCEMAGAPVFQADFFGAGVGFAFRADDTALLANVNAATQALRAEGDIAELTDRYLPFALN